MNIVIDTSLRGGGFSLHPLDVEKVKDGLKERAERLGSVWTDPDDIHTTPPKTLVCRNCDLCFSDNMEYDKHTVLEHPRRAGYPTR
jgi:hypothetical protein